MMMTGALMFDSIIGLACGVTHVGLDFRLSEINRRHKIERESFIDL